MGEDGVIVGLDDAYGEGERREGILDEGFRGIGGHLLAELDEAQAGAAVDSGELVESSAFDEVGDEFDIDLEEIPGGGDDKRSAVAFGARFSASAEAVLFEEFVDGEGGGDLFEALVYQELMDSLGSQASLFAEGEDSALEALFDVSFRVMGAAGAVQQTGTFSLSLVKALFPLVEGLAGDSQTAAS